ncbi:MAG: hypothetical protein GY861_28815, partial [bacterium]|nr:hypothetical protein [bacterium]
KKEKRDIKKLLIVLTFLITATNLTCNAATYYISKDGSDSNSGTSSRPWRTIGKANSTLRAGDTVYIRRGTYRETIRPSRSGTRGNEITYARYSNDEVIITGVSDAVNISERSYINIDGLKILDVSGQWVTMRPNGCYNTIQNCYMEEAGSYAGIRLRDGADYNKILNNTMVGYCGPDDLIQIYAGSHNLIDGNRMYYGPHDAIDVQDRPDGSASYNIIRNNYIQNKWHSNIDIEGIEYILVENNVIVDAGDDAANSPCGTDRAREFPIEGHKGISVNTRYGIYRNNVVINSGHFISLPSYDVIERGFSENNMIYHNTANKNYWGVRYIYDYPSTDNILKNNIIYDNTIYEIGITGSGYTENYYINNNILGASVRYKAGDTVRDTLSRDPLFVDEDGSSSSSVALIPDSLEQANESFRFELRSTTIRVEDRDLRLRSNSPMINRGAWLTETTSSGSGRTIHVEDARYFMDGWGIIEGDLIQLEGQQRTARITDVDYRNNTITVNTSLSWSRGDGVSLPYSGSRPDIGAYEYGG